MTKKKAVAAGRKKTQGPKFEASQMTNVNVAEVESRMNHRRWLLAEFKARSEKSKLYQKKVIKQLGKLIAGDRSLLKHGAKAQQVAP